MHKTTDHTSSSFQVGDRVYFKNKQPGKWDLKWRARYSIVCMEHDEHYLHIKNQSTGKTQSCNVKRCCTLATSQTMEHWYAILQSKQIHKSSCESSYNHLKH